MSQKIDFSFRLNLSLIFDLENVKLLFSSFTCSHIISGSTNAAPNSPNSTLKRIVLPESYLKEVRPPSIKGNPVLVEFSVFVVDINSINVEGNSP